MQERERNYKGNNYEGNIEALYAIYLILENSGVGKCWCWKILERQILVPESSEAGTLWCRKILLDFLAATDLVDMC